MKYLVLLGDGMADEPMDELGGKTVLQAARTPFMDRLASAGELGMAQTVPAAYHPGSDVANLSVFGYDPASCYTGRSPLEAASMGVRLAPEDVAFRLNLVDIVHHQGKLYMADFAAGHISSGEARELILSLQDELGDANFEFHPGVSYRHLLVWRNGEDRLRFVPPHDIINQSIEDKMPQGQGAEVLINLMTSAQMLLKNHPVNLRRIRDNQVPASSIWLWGHGRAPQMPTYAEKFGISGAVISAVDLIKGIGVYAGLEVIEVPGATGYVDTNYAGKAAAAIDALSRHDFVYLHVEAPDEAGHAGNLEEKIRAIERFDAEIVGAVLQQLSEPYRLLLLPDHPTPLHLRTHSRDPVPYVLYDSRQDRASGLTYCEQAAHSTGRFCEQGHLLLPQLLQRA